MKVWNVETNKLLDVLAIPPTKPVADFGITYQKKFILLSCIQANILSVYYNSLDNVNFDEDVDTIPTQSNDMPVRQTEPHKPPAAQNQAPVVEHSAQNRSQTEAQRHELVQP